ncbi:amidase signature domain-containing protein [Aspergillus carlsbadensis]|nr:amidase signature domain-containing protein [Aspergillus carlsbadensis]
MRRRSLLGATGFLAAVTPLLATDTHNHNSYHDVDVDIGVDTLVMSQVLTNPYAYDFPPINADNGGDLFPMRPCKGHQLLEASIDDLQALLSTGKLTSVELLQCYLERIYQTNSYLKAILQHNPDALRIASAIDQERSSGRIRGPLHGIPFIVKDNIATKDRMETTAGSWALLGSVVPRDAFAVHKLRQAGAVLLGKAALSEWADMRSNNYSEGYSARGGQCRSAYNLTVNPGGSSSGSAVAVGANLVPFALGTETDGSVINPAQRNAIVGIKPTVGLTSRDGVIPISLNQDTVGCFGKTVRDAVYVLDAIYGVDPRDNATFAQVGKTPARDAGGYTQFLADKSALQGATFGLPWESFWALGNDDQIAQLVELIHLLEDAGATIINGTELPHYETIVPPYGWDWDYGSVRGYPNESEYTYVKVDFYNNIRAYLAELDNTNIRSLEDIVRYNRENSGSEGGYPSINPAFGSGQDGFEASLASKGIMDETYYQALGFCRRTSREEGIDSALNLNKNKNNTTPLDGLLVPADVAQSLQIAAQAGYPAITIPAGTSDKSGMPYGLAILGTAFSEARLVRWASAIEDLQRGSGTKLWRSLPQWRGFAGRNVPVPFVDWG